MKYIFLLEVDNKVKPFEEASPQELEALNDKVKKSFETHMGLKYICKNEKTTQGDKDMPQCTKEKSFTYKRY